VGNHSFRLVVWIGFVLAAVCPAPLHAQTVSGTILGLIQDQQGAAIGKANISARSLDTGAVRTTTSADNGEYRIASVPAGSYEISISAPGFKTEVRSGITVTVGADVGLNFALTVGAVTEKIEVTAEAPQVDTSGSAMGGFVNSATIRELPLNGRDWLQLALLQPGALANAGVPQADSSRAQKGNGLQISISGGRVTENVFRIDGLVVNDYSNAGPGSSLHVNMGVDAIREFSVLTNNYSAEYGRGASGVINAITKSGTNEFHGSVYYFHRNSALDARNFFDGKTIAPFRRHQFGGAIGGRIKKDKTFFFSNYETLREAKGLSASVDTLSANARNGILTSGTITVDPRMKTYLQFYPLPNAGVTGDTGKFAFAAVRLGNEKYVIGKMDHYFSASTTLTGSYSYDNTTVTFPDLYDEKLSTAPSGKQNAVLSLQHIFSPSLINNTRAGVSRSFAGNNIDCCVKLPGLADVSLGFVPGQPVGTFSVTGIANVSGTALWGGIGSSGLNNFYYTAPQFYDDLSWTKGRHNMRMGFAFERVQENLDERNRPNGLWTFPSVRDMLLVNPTQFSAQFPGTDGIRGPRNSIIGAYIQDDFRIRPNLTINLGVRYDMDTVMKEVNGRLANLRNLTDPKVTIGDPYYHNPTFKNFAPRIGFAWDPTKNGKTAIRGGVGMFDIIPLPYLLVNLIPRSAPFYLEGSIPNPPSSSFPAHGFDLLSPSTVQATRVEFDPRRSYKMQWNLNIQRQLTRSLALTVGYVGSAGVHLAHMIYDYDQVPPSLVTFDGTNYRFPIPPGNNLKLVQRVNPNFGQIRSTDFQGHSSYHSLQTNLVQRLTKGLTYQIAYTWSKAIDNGSSTSGGSDNLNSLQGPWPFCQRCERGPSDYDIPHSFVLNFQYDVPVMASVKSHAVANTILGGWQVGGIYTRQTGGAYNVKITTDQAFTGNAVAGATSGGLRPNYLGNLPGCSPAEVTTGDISHLIKTSCFSFPGPGVLGNLGRDLFHMPVFRNLDFSVFKNQNLRGEQLKMQFRAEMFNILNNTNLTPQSFSNSFTNSGVLLGSFGTPTAPTYNQSRQIQFGLRLLF
jgi:hypothetical protein